MEYTHTCKYEMSLALRWKLVLKAIVMVTRLISLTMVRHATIVCSKKRPLLFPFELRKPTPISFKINTCQGTISCSYLKNSLVSNPAHDHIVLVVQVED